MSTMTLNGLTVVSGSVTIPLVGAWVADVVLPTPEDITDTVVLTVGDLELHGTVFRTSNAFAGSKSARIVGGAGGWRKVLPRKGYSQIVGLMASLVLQDAARECGETIVVDADRQLGGSWARETGKAERTLRLILGGEWWIDPAGVTQTKVRDSSLIGSVFTVAAWSGGKGHFEIATESYADWQPGRTFNASTINMVQTISMVRFETANDGKLRLIVLSEASERDRMLAEIRSLVRSELGPMTYCAQWDYSVAPRAPVDPIISSRLNLTSSDPRMPDLTNVPLAPGLVQSPPLAGTSCRVHFVNADPGRPEVVWIGGVTEHVMTTEACALLIYNTLATLMVAAGGGPLLAVTLQPLLGAAITAALGAQAVPAPPGFLAQSIASAALQAGFAAGTTPSPTTFAAWNAAIAAIDTKTPDISGLFPSVGIPSSGAPQ